jgi:hypothetical protein
VVERDGRAAFVDAVSVVETPTELRHDGAVVLGFAPATRSAPLSLDRRPSTLRWGTLDVAPPKAVRAAVVLDLSTVRLP